MYYFQNCIKSHYIEAMIKSKIKWATGLYNQKSTVDKLTVLHRLPEK